ncbi:hypothetical protein XELAEV_18009336mg [Xenopus laevis]|uniref:Uncharacterized protein n=1 Tax=Xenopus laevis TaxID=8355 RepID=A0A974I0N3_XENLA|nr:hypothetical protein XELAEV_18009336mg [Xenopus laevis]
MPEVSKTSFIRQKLKMWLNLSCSITMIQSGEQDGGTDQSIPPMLYQIEAAITKPRQELNMKRRCRAQEVQKTANTWFISLLLCGTPEAT